MTDLRQSSPGGAAGPTSPPPSPRRARTPRRLVVTGLAVAAISALAGIGLFVHGLGMLATLPDPQGVDGSRRVVAEDEGEAFLLFVVGQATTEGCRVTSESGAAVAVNRAPATTRTVGEVTYQAQAEFEAPDAGYLDVECPPGPVYVAPEGHVGRNVLTLLVGVLLGLVGVIGGVTMVVVGLVLSATASTRSLPDPTWPPAVRGGPPRWPPP